MSTFSISATHRQALRLTPVALVPQQVTRLTQIQQAEHGWPSVAQPGINSSPFDARREHTRQLVPCAGRPSVPCIAGGGDGGGDRLRVFAMGEERVGCRSLPCLEVVATLRPSRALLAIHANTCHLSTSPSFALRPFQSILCAMSSLRSSRPRASVSSTSTRPLNLLPFEHRAPCAPVPYANAGWTSPLLIYQTSTFLRPSILVCRRRPVRPQPHRRVRSQLRRCSTRLPLGHTPQQRARSRRRRRTRTILTGC